MSDITALILTSVLVNNLLIGFIFLIRRKLEQIMSMIQLDKILKTLLLFFFLVTPVLVESVFVLRVYRNLDTYNGDDGLNIIWREADYSLNNTTPFGDHIFFIILFVLWMLGIIILGFIQYRKEKKVLRFLFDYSEQMQEYELNRVCNEIGYKKAIEFRQSDLIDIPFTTGCFKPIIYFPKFGIYAAGQKLIFKHEAYHCKAYDCLYRKILFWINVLYWFNPFLRIFTEYFVEINELACDERVLEGLDKKDLYHYAKLLAVMECQTDFLKNAVFLTGYKKSLLERRLECMKIRKKGMKRYALVVTSVVLSLTCSMTTLAASAGAGEIQCIISENIYDGNEVITENDAFMEESDVIDLNSIQAPVTRIETRGVTIVDEDIPEGQRIVFGYLNLSVGDKVSVAFIANSSSASFRAGYIDSDGNRTFVRSSSGDIAHTFTMSKADRYKIYIENLGDGDIHVSGSITVL